MTWLPSSGGIHAHDAAPALVQIADDVAHVAVGHGDLQLAHRLQQDRVGLRQGGLVGQLGGGLEGDLGGVHRVVGAVVQHGLQVHHGVAGQRDRGRRPPAGPSPPRGRSSWARCRRRPPRRRSCRPARSGARSGSTRRRTGRCRRSASCGGPASGNGLADLLPVGHPDGLQLRLHVEAALELADQHVHLHVAGAGEHHLVGLGVVGDGEGGVLLVDAG